MKWHSKAACKRAPQRELKLTVDLSSPVLGVISRLDAQKGHDLIVKASSRLVEDGSQLIVHVYRSVTRLA